MSNHNVGTIACTIIGCLTFVMTGCKHSGITTHASAMSEPIKSKTPPTFMNSESTKILMIGNSHTGTGMVQSTVQKYVEYETQKMVEIRAVFVPFLSDAVNRSDVSELMGRADIIVFQGQKLSQSHKYIYSTDEAIKLANNAKDAGKTVLWFAEWSRRGVEETNYIEDIYAGISKASTGKIVPTGRVFDFVAKEFPRRELYSADGNHASQDGSFYAGLTIASFCVDGFKSSDLPLPNSIDEKEFRSVLAYIQSLHKADK